MSQLYIVDCIGALWRLVYCRYKYNLGLAMALIPPNPSHAPHPRAQPCVYMHHPPLRAAWCSPLHLPPHPHHASDRKQQHRQCAPMIRWLRQVAVLLLNASPCATVEAQLPPLALPPATARRQKCHRQAHPLTPSPIPSSATCALLLTPRACFYASLRA